MKGCSKCFNVAGYKEKSKKQRFTRKIRCDFHFMSKDLRLRCMFGTSA